jgi:RNA-dependent RNA polymerase
MAKTIFANSVDFGLQIGETTMVAMHSVNAPSKVRVFLNMERKEINIQFPLMIDDRKQYYRFRLPLAQIDRVHLADNDGSGQGLLVIPFKFPPQFFRRAKQADMHRTFSPSDKIWSETNSWYRITDIVDAQTEDRKTNLPIMNRKEDVVIDIGKFSLWMFDSDLLITYV